jgi:hypothetical protein
LSGLESPSLTLSREQRTEDRGTNPDAPDF